MKLDPAGIRRRIATAVAVLAAGLAVSVVAAFLVKWQLEREARREFEDATAEAQTAIESRIKAYADLLAGIRGLFVAHESVSRAEFRRYIASLDLERRFPGIQVIHYSRLVSAAQRPAFEAMVRADASIQPGGYPKFAIRPPGERPEYVVATYVEPMAGNEIALGLDLAGDPVRLAALERTRDSGRLTASGVIALALDPKRHPGFATRIAVYRRDAPLDTVAQRRAAFEGVVSASFIVIDLMRGVLSEPFLEKMHVRIHDAGFLNGEQLLEPPGAGNLMFDSDRLLAEASAARAAAGGADAVDLKSMSSIEFGGRRWNLYFSARRPPGAATDRWLPLIVLVTGSVISLLLFGLTRSLATAGSRAMALAERITADLRRSEADLAEAQRVTQQLIEALPIPVFFKDTVGRYLGVNRAWEAYFDTPRGAFVGKTVFDLYPHNPAVAQRLDAMDQELWRNPGAPLVHEAAITTRDGRQRDAIYYKAIFTRTDGSMAGLIGTIVDITERKQAEKALRESDSRYRSVVAAIAEGVLLRDRDGRIITCNASAERILGRTLEEMRGDVFFDPRWQAIREDGSVFPADERPVRTALRTGRLQSGVVVGFRRPDGGVLWLSMNAQPLFEEPGAAPSGVVTTITDVTQRKQTELQQALQHKVTRLLSDSETLEEFLPNFLRVLCEALDSACGACWLRDEENRQAVCTAAWHVDAPEVAAFVAHGGAALTLPPPPGGLIRRAWESGEPVWIAEVAQEPTFRRAPLAAQAGLKGAFAFAIHFDNEVFGVVEFFSRHDRPPDAALAQNARSIGGQIGQFVARKRAEARVRRLANYDELTALPNRSMFHQRVGHALAQARRNKRSLAIVFIDLDRFKNINDTLGHDAGDQVLKEVATRLRGCLRESDTVGRLGGDEFVVLIEELAQPAQAASVARKVLAVVADPIRLAAQEVLVTASIGISTFPGDSEDMQGLMKNADIAMYRAKEQGKNNFLFYSAQMNVHTLERLAMESDLRRALAREEFLLHYQPRVEIGGGRIVGVEALLRWQPPARALVPPAQFIPLAEETGLIVQIGEWVLETACARSRSWQDQGLPQLRMAVNLSARQFAQESLVQDVARVLEQSGLPAAALELEITESMVMSNPQRAVKLLGQLKDMGIYLSVDDFGTGYSSLGYLKRFPIDCVKIDRSFVEALPGDRDDAAITEAIIAMAHALSLKVTAEGVETEEQLRFLRARGCDEMQGYYFSRPLPEEEFLRLLREAPAAARKRRGAGDKQAMR